MRAFIILSLLAVASAFSSRFAPSKLFSCSFHQQTVNTKVTSGVTARTSLKMTTPGPSYWEGKAPASSVLGVGEKIPSAVFGPLSLVALIAGTYSVHESNIFNQLSSTSLSPLYVIGSLLVPISWGLHVAAWIQKENGK